MNENEQYLQDQWGKRTSWNKGIRDQPDGRRVCAICFEPKNIEEFVKCKRRHRGYGSYCKPCHNARYKHKKHNPKDYYPSYAKRKYVDGYTVIDGLGEFKNGSKLTWTEVHQHPSIHTFPDGMTLMRNKTGELYEIFNKPELHPVES